MQSRLYLFSLLHWMILYLDNSHTILNITTIFIANIIIQEISCFLLLYILLIWYHPLIFHLP